MNAPAPINHERELNVLYEISCAMRSTLELRHVLYIILTGVTSHSGLGYNRAVLFLVNEQKNRLECQMAIGPESGEHADKVWKYIDSSKQDLEDLIQEDKLQTVYSGSSLFHSLRNLSFSLENKDFLLTQAFDRGTPWLLTPEEISQYLNDPLLRSFPTEELIIMPLKAKDRVNGLIIADNIYTKKPIADQDIRFFTMLANQAGLAIENSRLYEMVVERSQTDSLTGLWNHGYFQKTLLAEIEKSKRSQQPLSLLMIDIDNFKQLNDTCGHQHGDLILKEISQILLESSRTPDYTCRYGGEEMTMILTNTARDQSYEIAERVRRRIEAHEFPSPSGVGVLHFTVSIGLSAYPVDAQDKEKLIALADQAMYRAKAEGKNRTCLA